MIPVSCWCLILLLLVSRAIASEVSKPNHPKPPKSSEDINDEKNHHDYVPPSSSDVPHSRTKRLIWVTDDGRLALPPGTSLVIAPTLAMPFIRYPPDGFHSNISISIPLTSNVTVYTEKNQLTILNNSVSVDFDKLGLTDNQNPLGTLGPLFARSLSRSAGHVLADYVFKYLKHRTKRDNRVDNETPKLPETLKHAFHGGERAILYAVLEDFLSQFGLDGIFQIHVPFNKLTYFDRFQVMAVFLGQYVKYTRKMFIDSV